MQFKGFRLTFFVSAAASISKMRDSFSRCVYSSRVHRLWPPLLASFTEMMLICVLKLCEQLNSKKADIFQVHFTYLLIGLLLTFKKETFGLT